MDVNANRTCRICSFFGTLDKFAKGENLCKECVRERHRAWKCKNAVKINTYKKLWYSINKEDILQERKKKYNENKTVFLHKNKLWKEKNIDRKKQLDRLYRIRNPDKIRDTRKRHAQSQGEKRNNMIKSLDSRYVLELIRRSTGIDRSILQMLPSIINVKREHLKTLRIIRNGTEI